MVVLPQAAKLVLQVKPHDVPSHVAVELAGWGQAVHDVGPHVAGEELFTHALEQRCWVAVQVGVQVPI